MQICSSVVVFQFFSNYAEIGFCFDKINAKVKKFAVTAEKILQIPVLSLHNV